jgi:hypothetical protein
LQTCGTMGFCLPVRLSAVAKVVLAAAAVCASCASTRVEATAMAAGGGGAAPDSSEVGRVWFELGDEKAASGDMEGAADAFFHALTSGFKPPDEAFRRFVVSESLTD